MKTPATTIGGGVSRRGRLRKPTNLKRKYSDSTNDRSADKTKININGMLIDIESITDE